MIGSVIELILFSLPSAFYVRHLRRRGQAPGPARAAVGWQAGTPAAYGLAAAATLILLPITYLALHSIPHGALAPRTSSGLHTTFGQVSTPGGYVQTALLAVAEEVLFRGLLAGWLMRRLGFAAGNLLQALVFLAPHLLLLLVSTAFWPLLPVQFAAGWLLGLLRYKSGSIGPPALAHVAANVLAPLLLSV
jgi:membrane protease YdiL (CAAX protease family)